MSNYIQLVAQLRAAREAWNLPHEDLAEILGVHKRTIFKWDSRECSPNIGEMLRWADALGCNLKAEARK